MGYELEFNGADLPFLSKNYHVQVHAKEEKIDYNIFNLKEEYEVTKNNKGGELISPVYQNIQDLKKELNTWLIKLKKAKAYISYEEDKNIGFHIHVSKNFLNKDFQKYLDLLKFLVAFKYEISSIAKGDNKYLRPMAALEVLSLTKDVVYKFMLADEKTLTELTKKIYPVRFTKQTMELRYFNSSLNFATLEKYIDFTTALVKTFESDYDYDLINYYFINQNAKNRSASFKKLLSL